MTDARTPDGIVLLLLVLDATPPVVTTAAMTSSGVLFIRTFVEKWRVSLSWNVQRIRGQLFAQILGIGNVTGMVAD